MKPLQHFFVRSRRAVMSPRLYARLVLERALVEIRRRPQWKGRMLAALRLVPPLERRLWRFAAVRNGVADVALPYVPTWFIDADPDVLAQWKRITAPAVEPVEGAAAR